MDYQQLEPYFGTKKVCFNCLQRDNFKPQIVVLKNHKGFLCESCAKDHRSIRVNTAYASYHIHRQYHQPAIGDLVDEILRVSDSGFRGRAIEYFAIIRNNDKYNHLLVDNVRIALELLSDEELLSESYEFSVLPIYFDPTKQGKTKR